MRTGPTSTKKPLNQVISNRVEIEPLELVQESISNSRTKIHDSRYPVQEKLPMSNLEKEVALRPTTPEGLRFLSDFISESDEQCLIAELAKLDWDGVGAFERRGRIVKRREIGFLHDYGRHNRQISEGLPLPEFLKGLREACAEAVGIEIESFQQVIASFYRPGAGIAWHVPRF